VAGRNAVGQCGADKALVTGALGTDLVTDRLGQLAVVFKVDTDVSPVGLHESEDVGHRTEEEVRRCKAEALAFRVPVQQQVDE
jgi:hypothetical protein